MATCKVCGKENQDLYKFCLGCGAELKAAGPTVEPAASPEADASKRAATPEVMPVEKTDPLAVGRNGTPAADPTPAPVEATAPRMCPSCGHSVPAEFAFCGQCGARMAPRRSSAGRTAVASAPAQGGVRGRLVLLRPDGNEGGTFPLHEGENPVGRGLGPLFDADGYLSPSHAELVLNAAGLVVRDAGSLNGVFLKLTEEEELIDGDIFRVGQELLRFDEIRPPARLDDGTDIMGSPNPGYWGRLALIVGRDQDGSAFPLFGDSVILGRERGDILFPEDGYVSGQHARMTLRNRRYYLSDLNSSNGTFLRIRGERQLRSGAALLMGQQLFRVSYS